MLLYGMFVQCGMVYTIELSGWIAMLLPFLVNTVSCTVISYFPF